MKVLRKSEIVRLRQVEHVNAERYILSRIQHLNVTDNIIDRSRSAVAYGGFCEVFRGHLRQDGCENLAVAIKRLRFHVDEEKVEKVGPLAPPSVARISL